MTSRCRWRSVTLSDGVRIAYPVGIRGEALEVYASPMSAAMVWRTFGELDEAHRRELVRMGWPYQPRRD